MSKNRLAGTPSAWSKGVRVGVHAHDVGAGGIGRHGEEVAMALKTSSDRRTIKLLHERVRLNGVLDAHAIH